MKNTRWIIVFDMETDGVDPYSCNPVQLSAMPMCPETLEIKEDIFDVIIRPDDIDNEKYFTKDVMETIKWHAKNYNTTPEQIIEKWKGGIPSLIAFTSFNQYCNKYEVDKKFGVWHTKPIPAGYNINSFDMVILKRFIDKHKLKFPLSEGNKLDMYDNIFWWFENLDEPKDLKLDTLREFFGMEAHGKAHDAVFDVKDTAKIVQRFLKFHRKQSHINKFKGVFSD